jgi:hypothetical protein
VVFLGSICTNTAIYPNYSHTLTPSILAYHFKGQESSICYPLPADQFHHAIGGKPRSIHPARSKGLGRQVCHTLDEGSQGIYILGDYQYNRRFDVSRNFLPHFLPLSQLLRSSFSSSRSFIDIDGCTGLFIA